MKNFQKKEGMKVQTELSDRHDTYQRLKELNTLFDELIKEEQGSARYQWKVKQYRLNLAADIKYEQQAASNRAVEASTTEANIGKLREEIKELKKSEIETQRSLEATNESLVEAQNALTMLETTKNAEIARLKDDNQDLRLNEEYQQQYPIKAIKQLNFSIITTGLITFVILLVQAFQNQSMLLTNLITAGVIIGLDGVIYRVRGCFLLKDQQIRLFSKRQIRQIALNINAATTVLLGVQPLLSQSILFCFQSQSWQNYNLFQNLLTIAVLIAGVVLFFIFYCKGNDLIKKYKRERQLRQIMN